MVAIGDFVLPGLVVFWGLCFVIVLRGATKRKLVILAPGLRREITLQKGTEDVEVGKHMYHIFPDKFFNDPLWGFLPRQRIFYFEGSPLPVGYYEGEPKTNPEELKFQVEGIYECPKCKGTTFKLQATVGSRLFRVLMLDKAIRELGEEPHEKRNWSMLVYLMIGVIVALFVVVLLTHGSATTIQIPTPTLTPIP